MITFINPTTIVHSTLTSTLHRHPRAALSADEPQPQPPTTASRRKTLSGLLIATSLSTIIGGARTAAASDEQRWGTRSFLWEHFFEPELSPEDAAARIRNTAEGLRGLKYMVETMAWRYLIFYIRLKSAYLKQDMKAALTTVPAGRRKDYIETANELIDNIAEFDYYVRTPKVFESYVYYQKTSKSIDNLVTMLA